MKWDIHIADETQGRDEHDDIMFALCGQRIYFGASTFKTCFGMFNQVNCEGCLSKAAELNYTGSIYPHLYP